MQPPTSPPSPDSRSFPWPRLWIFNEFLTIQFLPRVHPRAPPPRRCNFQQLRRVRVDEVEKAESQNGCGREDRGWVDVKCRGGKESGREVTLESGIMNNSERGIRLAAARTSAIQKPNSRPALLRGARKEIRIRVVSSVLSFSRPSVCP